LDKSFTNSI